MLDREMKVLTAEALWGESTLIQPKFTSDNCWAIKNHKPYRFFDSNNPSECKHVMAGHSVSSHLCMPITVQKQIVGVFYIAPHLERDTITPTQENLITTTVEQVDLALSNLDLRDNLRDQAIHDPLTGLFNRLYMEETLKRELHRVERAQNPLCIIMLDIDHFKKFNDTYGHQAGDALLRELGNFLRSFVRASDVACRYGGEEFILILPDTLADAAWERAEQLRQRVKNITINHEGKTLGNITVSIGISAWPENGQNAEMVIDAADEAMYQAKQQGRDRCMLAQPSQKLK